MEDDVENQSHTSEGSRSPPTSQRSNGRITVTVATVPPPPQTQTQNNNTLTLALPTTQQLSKPAGTTTGGGGGGGRDDCWSEGATAVLVDSWGERYLELSRGNLKQNHWREVADIVNSRGDYTKPPKTDIQCKNRIDTVKKKYKLEKAKIASGQGPSKWVFFEKLEYFIGPSPKINPTVAGSSRSHSGNLNVPMGIPITSVPQLRQPKQKQKSRKRPPPVDSDSSESEPELSPDSTDSYPPETYQRKIPKIQMNSKGESSGRRDENWGNSVTELSRAILKFGEAYEHTEKAKLQQIVEMEKQRMKFAKEMELQRMQFFMKTQMELSQLKHHHRRAGNSNHHHHNHSNNNANANAINHNNRDSRI